MDEGKQMSLGVLFLFQRELREETLQTVDYGSYQHNIPTNAIKLYTNGSKINEITESNIYTETPRRRYNLRRHNPDSCFVFRNKLMVIDEGLELVKSESDFDDLWILTDSPSSLQHLSNWYLDQVKAYFSKNH
ncbi:RNase H domain-containing protein [Trichonephila clavipes]|nr:RNase H domain-containing protein [Trichonephila clavipes]